MERPDSRLALTLLVALALLPSCGGDSGTPTEPQLLTGTIQGTVTVAGSPGADLLLFATGPDTSSAVVQASGSYSMSGLSPGEYMVTIRGYGRDVSFATYQQPAVIAGGGDEFTVSFTGTHIQIGANLDLDQFSLIPAGTFQMGSEKGAAVEKPVHTVRLTRDFYLLKTEVTQQQWESVMGSNPTQYPSCGGDCPVDWVTWDDVQAFIDKLNQENPGSAYRLPTEAEWEYAARAGTTGDYGGTGVMDEMGWYEGNSGGQPHPVAMKLPNAWGVYDMHGNVWEWAHDRWSETYYSTSPVNDPPGPDDSAASARVTRGSSWYTSASAARSAARTPLTSFVRASNLGFRIAKNR